MGWLKLPVKKEKYNPPHLTRFSSGLGFVFSKIPKSVDCVAIGTTDLTRCYV